MTTPIYDFLQEYINSDFIRLHMPGHKGKNITELSYSMDITEINGADSLFDASGIIDESEKNAAKLFKTVRTCYSAGGSTLCIQAMLTMMKRENRNVIAVRNVHRSFIAACVLLGIEPEWIYPKYTAGILSGQIPMDILEDKLKRTENACVYLTSPDYLGKIVDIKAVSALCRKYKAVLLVDNAHGAHTAFTGTHPIALGADMCCDSAHKMLPALTGAAYLHIGNERYSAKAKTAMSLFGSTSPSYLIMASLDLCNRYISEQIAEDINRSLSAIEDLRKTIGQKYTVYDGEPYHLTLLCNGNDLAKQLREKNIECEYYDSNVIVLLFSPADSPEEIKYTADKLMVCEPKKSENSYITDFPIMEKAMSVRKAALSDFQNIDVDKSLGRICAAVNVPCPPAVPIAVSGEIINEKCIKIYKNYGILNVNVIK